jgi:hypothetical protein
VLCVIHMWTCLLRYAPASRFGAIFLVASDGVLGWSDLVLALCGCHTFYVCSVVYVPASV